MTRLEEVVIKEQRLRDLMAEKGLAGILLKKQANFSWLTAGGYNMVGIAAEMGVTALLITPNAKYIIASKIEMQRMLVEEGLQALGFQPLEYEWYLDREGEMVRKIIPELRKVGADTGFADCPNMEGEIRNLRASLTAGEMERYRFLGTKLSDALEQVMLGIRPGDKECEIAGRVGVELWKDRIDPTGILIAADERVAQYRHPIPTEKKVGRYVMCAANARYKGLITSITRSLHFGKPAPELTKQFAQNLEVENRMIAATKVGKPMKDGFAAALAAYREFGVPEEWTLHHQGGSMGYFSRDIKVTDRTPDIVQENQAFCWNPTITGTKTEDGFIATAQGPVMLSHPVAFPAVRQEIAGIQLVRPGMLVVD